MAARNLAPIFALDRDVTLLFGGGVGAGANPLTAIKGPGITSIAQTGTGLYTITLTDKWANILFVTGTVIDVTTPDDWTVNVAAKSASAKTIDIQTFKGGALADLNSTEQLMLMIAVGNTAQPAGATRP